MENAIIERIKGVIEKKGLSPRSFAQSIGFNYSTLNNYLTGRRSSIDNELVVKIVSTFGDISSDWLLTGEGPMLKETGGITLQDTPGFELSGLKQDVKRVDAELCKAKEEIKALCGVIELLKKENTELHKQLIAEKERLINVLMEKK